MENRKIEKETRTSFVRRLKARDENSWQEFYEQHRQMIYARAITRGLSQAEAEEVVQETFLTLFKKIEEFIYDPSRGRLTGFVAQTAGWRIEDQRDKRLPEPATEPRQEQETERTAFIHRLPDNAHSAIEALEKKESGQLAKAVHDAVMRRIKKRTSLKQYQIYELHNLQGLPVEEVCRVLGAKPQDVYNATARICHRIQEEVEKLRQEAAESGSHGNTRVLFRYLEKDMSSHKRAAR